MDSSLLLHNLHTSHGQQEAEQEENKKHPEDAM